MPDANMEIQVRSSTLDRNERKLSAVVSAGNMHGNSSLHNVDGSESGGDDCDSCDDQPIPLKKIRVKNGKSKMTDSNGNSASNSDQQDDDDCSVSGPCMKEGGVSTSFTSGENSDADGGTEGEDHINGGRQENTRSFECDVCNMKFSNGANMRRHKMRHSGVKPYECKICQKRFFRKDHLAEHSATHSKLLPFRCPICNKGFQRQIAMRAHFQNEHVGGGSEVVKACPLCAYKAGSMKSLRVHFRSRHGIDLDNPVPSPSLQTSSSGNGRHSGSPPSSNSGEYSELAHALGFEDREKSNDSLIPSHFLVPQIEISSNSPYPTHFAFTHADSSYNDRHRSSSSPPSDSNDRISSSDLVSVVVKKEILSMEDQSSSFCNGDRDRESKSKDGSDNPDPDDDQPEDLSISSISPKAQCCSSTPNKLSPLKSLLREDWNNNNSSSKDNGLQLSVSTAATTSSRSRSDSSGNSSGGYNSQSYEGEDITSSMGLDSGAGHSVYNRRGTFSSGSYICNFCKIVFPDKTLYFLHKGCHSQTNPLVCNLCNTECLNVFDFNSHLLSKSHN